MKHRSVMLIAILLFGFFFIEMFSCRRILAQKSEPQNLSSFLKGHGLQEDIEDLKNKWHYANQTQNLIIDSLKESNEQYNSLLKNISTVLWVVIIAQGIVTVYHMKREESKDEKQALRQEMRDKVEETSTVQVIKIMDVVDRTLENRLNAEQKARDEADQARKELHDVMDDMGQFWNNYKSNIQKNRQKIEQKASELTQISRHNFKSKINDLKEFSDQLDMFRSFFEGMEGGSEHPFSPRVLYIDGIAAHYANNPKKAIQFLTKVMEFQNPEEGEAPNAYIRRKANSTYFLGVIQLNFGHIQMAIDFFEHANSLDEEHKDFLTKLVNAEAYVMKHDFQEAFKWTKFVEDGCEAMIKQKRDINDYLRLQSRASLIRANGVILQNNADWSNKVEMILKKVYENDPNYYYASATLAQIYAKQGNRTAANELFNETYHIIEHSFDLITVTEVRSKILLEMTAGLCCYQGGEEKRAQEHLDKAQKLLSVLPRMDSSLCTAFSPLSKQNETKETLLHHIQEIHNGEILSEHI